MFYINLIYSTYICICIYYINFQLQKTMSELQDVCQAFVDFFDIVIDKYITHFTNPKREWQYFKSLLNDIDLTRIKNYISVLKTSNQPLPQQQTLIQKPIIQLQTRQNLELNTNLKEIESLRKVCSLKEMPKKEFVSMEQTRKPKETEINEQVKELTSKIVFLYESNTQTIDILLKTSKISKDYILAQAQRREYRDSIENFSEFCSI